MSAHARILVVEDEPRLGELLRLYLERDGYAVTVVGDGRAAIDAVEADGVDLVVLDLMLPGLGGEAVLEAIRDHGDIPVLIASAKRSDAGAHRRPADGRRRLPGQAVQPARADRARRRHPAAQRPGQRGRRDRTRPCSRSPTAAWSSTR